MIGILTGYGEEEEEIFEGVTLEHRNENKTYSACPKDKHEHLN